MKDKHDLELYFVNTETISDDIVLLIQKLKHLPLKDLINVMFFFECEVEKMFKEIGLEIEIVESKRKSFKEFLEMQKIV